MEKKQIKFPFEPNETVKAAFRRHEALRQMTKLITEALLLGATDCAINPWDVLYKEHPEVLDASKQLAYNHLFQIIDLKGK